MAPSLRMTPAIFGVISILEFGYVILMTVWWFREIFGIQGPTVNIIDQSVNNVLVGHIKTPANMLPQTIAMLGFIANILITVVYLPWMFLSALVNQMSIRAFAALTVLASILAAGSGIATLTGLFLSLSKHFTILALPGSSAGSLHFSQGCVSYSFDKSSFFCPENLMQKCSEFIANQCNREMEKITIAILYTSIVTLIRLVLVLFFILVTFELTVPFGEVELETFDNNEYQQKSGEFGQQSQALVPISSFNSPPVLKASSSNGIPSIYHISTTPPNQQTGAPTIVYV